MQDEITANSAFHQNDIKATTEKLVKVHNEEAEALRSQIKELKDKNEQMQAKLQATACSECNKWSYEMRTIQKQLDDATYEVTKRQDEVMYLREENSRLEKQVSLMKLEIEKSSNNSSSPNDFRHLLKSEKEQSKSITTSHKFFDLFNHWVSPT